MYTSEFYRDRRELTQTSANIVLNILWEIYRPSSVIDVGCATGIWLATCKKLGAKKVLGIDGSWVPKNELEIEISEFIEQDIKSLKTDYPLDYDLAICIEVAEHIELQYADKLVEYLTLSSNVVLFSAAIPGQGGTGHINEQPQSYWINKLFRSGYECYDYIRPKIWADNRVNVIYKQNMLLFIKKGFLDELISNSTDLKENIISYMMTMKVTGFILIYFYLNKMMIQEDSW